MDSVPRQQHEDLQQRFEDLENEYKRSLERLNKAGAKIKRQNETIRSWQRYYDTHPKYTKPHGSGHKSEPKPVTPPDAVLAAPSPLVTPPRPNDEEALVDEGIAHAEAVLPEYHESKAPNQVSTIKHEIIHHRSSSQSTQLDSDDKKGDHAVFAPVDDDDEPEVISTRVVRKPGRRAGNHDNATALRSEGTPAQPHRIKREDTGPSQSMSNVPAFLRSVTQMSDLDTLVAHVETPKKRQKMIELEEDEGNRTIRATKTEKLNNLLRTARDENTPPSGSQRLRDSQTSNRSRPRSSGGPLQPLSANAPTLPRTSDPSAKRDRAYHEDSEERLADGVSRLAEDDTNFLSPDKQNSRRLRRLEGLLQGDDAAKNVLTPRALSNSRSPIAPRNPVSPLTATRPKRAQKPVARTSKSPPTVSPARRKRAASPSAKPLKRTRISRSPPPSPLPEEEPLRARPLHRLVPDDFRINPLYAGTDYAFNAPLRDHASRQCVPGCTRPCCAALQHFAGADTPRGRAHTRGAAEDEDDLLREHLGHDPAFLTSSQRESLLRSARAQKVANKYGKHKQVFERRQSPPGFWDTEMPSTQDRQEHKKQAKERERQDVEERWREAVRGDGRGRWTFKDELPGKTR
ncbi:Hypothetical protein D9617_1g086700 [Elsinoe fawcettii]|nr:Hypothetical protein D9617_1g086700 [Elsinoe fawcettii]